MITGRMDKAAAWIYSGVWRAVVEWLRMPPAPTLPTKPGEHVETFHPAPGFLKYLKFWFWLVLMVFDGLILFAWAIIFSLNTIVGWALLPLFLIVAVVPDIIAYIAIHLRYDTTWYVMSDRSMRLRRGVWTVTEISITHENVQNVKVRSGPVQRAFGISDVIVETAGAGGSSAGSGHHAVSNQGLIEGIADAERIRDLIMRRVRASRSAGLGDERHEEVSASGMWTPAHLTVLREIRDELAPAAG